MQPRTPEPQPSPPEVSFAWSSALLLQLLLLLLSDWPCPESCKISHATSLTPEMSSPWVSAVKLARLLPPPPLLLLLLAQANNKAQ
jgi:hypothetical protein